MYSNVYICGGANEDRTDQTMTAVSVLPTIVALQFFMHVQNC